MSYLDVPKIYNDPIISRKRKGTNLDPFRNITESMTVEKHYVLLSEIPNRYEKVKVSVPNTNQEMYEVEKEDGLLRSNDFRVDYVNGLVYFHESMIGKTLDFKYLGEGVFLFPDSRVYHTADDRFPNLRDKIIDVDRSILVERHRIDEQIISHPQPSEVVDLRIDYNGKVFRVAKDRIDAEQRKIEEAYVDANGKKFPSLKKRIDSLQLAQKKSEDKQKAENTKIWSEISIIPGRITLEVGKLHEIVNKEVTLLQSQIDMTPERINLEVKKLKEYTDGRIDSSYSQIEMLSNRINLKVDVNGVISSINLSKEGIRLQGRRIHLDGQAKIDDAIIKSAHIDSISADKIRTGILRSQNDNTVWNLNTGQLTLKNTDFKLGGKANIHFTDRNNRIYYNQVDPETGILHYSGVGVGRNVNERFPFAFLGTSTGDRLDTHIGQNFTGFITNTEARVEADNIGNSVVGDRFHIRDEARRYRYGWAWDLDGKVKVLRPMNSHHEGIHYDIGLYNRRFRDIYVNQVKHNGDIKLRDSRDGRTGGWLVQTHYAGDGTHITFRGLNGGKYNYRIGGKESYNRITRIYLKRKPNVSSDRRLKEEFEDVGLGLDFVMDLKPTSFKFKETEADKTINQHEFGFIAQEVEESMLKFNKNSDKYSLLSIDKDGFYAMEHEQLIAPIVKSIQELYRTTISENEKLKERVSKLEAIINKGGM